MLSHFVLNRRSWLPQRCARCHQRGTSCHGPDVSHSHRRDGCNNFRSSKWPLCTIDVKRRIVLIMVELVCCRQGAQLSSLRRSDSSRICPLASRTRSRHNRKVRSAGFLFNSSFTAVAGMIAIEANGSMSCGTTTNGASHKVPGRVGDSPIVGSGAYCDSAVGGAAGALQRFAPR
jgi:hypothetical protein